MACMSDPVQLKSTGIFISSLSRALESLPENGSSQELNPLMRELRADGLRRALELCSGEDRKRFLEALTANVQKFPPHEQKTLARILPVEISPEYRQLALAEGGAEAKQPLAAGMSQMPFAPPLDNGGRPVAAAPCPAFQPGPMLAAPAAGLAPMAPHLNMMPGQTQQLQFGGFSMPAAMPTLLPPSFCAAPQPGQQLVKFGLEDDEL
mmetsp:Transcript_19314/g.43385  ORF Transcript_19314/g.43385 Transcript_19314/m.43385 type:complete len:208 (-) Transcript_19314:176-799(-)